MGALYQNKWKILIGLFFLGVVGSAGGLYLSFGPPDLIAKTEAPLFCSSRHTLESEYEAWFHLGAHRTVKCVDRQMPYTVAGVSVPIQVVLEIMKYVDQRGEKKLRFALALEFKGPMGIQDRF
jgi:hypothetical protein